MANGDGDVSHEHKSVEERHPVHIEAALRDESTTPSETIRARVLALLDAQGITVYRNGDIDFADDTLLKQNIHSLRICDTPADVPFFQGDVRVHVFPLSDEGACEETLEGGDVNACSQWVLPAREFDGLWDSLVFGCAIKNRLLEYISTAPVAFSAEPAPLVQIDRLIITINSQRLIIFAFRRQVIIFRPTRGPEHHFLEPGGPLAWPSRDRENNALQGPCPEGVDSALGQVPQRAPSGN